MNRLAQEKSPYLRQHADNPVDWHAWNPEALALARKLDRPILLSVGYSACHWCHVMAHESFENPRIAELMNQHFVNIKVDRQERPDLDQIYQNVAQIFTRTGGWPLTVFLTPDLKPFYGGTYFPPEDRYGRPGFDRVLISVSEAFKADRPKILASSEQITGMITKMESLEVSERSGPELDLLKQYADHIDSAIDPVWGGTAGAPKFPNPMILTFLWRMGVYENRLEARQSVVVSLRRMAQGGIFDQLGGGFHRYSVDETWSVPHFEKMLYDNALLLKLYSEVLISNPPDLSPKDRALFIDTVVLTVSYLEREMVSPGGLFYSAQDADSEGEEGKFFVWKPDELRTILSVDEFAAFTRFFGVTDQGNFEHGATVLAQKETDLLSEEELIRGARAKAFAQRESRIRPSLDDQILISWNALMVSGLLQVERAMASHHPNTAQAARRMADRACCELQSRGAEARFLDDYAYLAQMWIDASQSEIDPIKSEAHIERARQTIDTLLAHFKDPRGEGYYFTRDDDESLIERPKTIYDQAIPSGVAVAIGALQALAHLVEDIPWCQMAEQEVASQLAVLFPLLPKAPLGLGELASVALRQVRRVKTVGTQTSPISASENPPRYAFDIFWKPSQNLGLIWCEREQCQEISLSELAAKFVRQI